MLLLVSCPMAHLRRFDIVDVQHFTSRRSQTIEQGLFLRSRSMFALASHRSAWVSECFEPALVVSHIRSVHVLSDTPIASAIASCVRSPSSTIWMRWRCSGRPFHRSAVFNRRTSHCGAELTICSLAIEQSKNSRLTTENNPFRSTFPPPQPFESISYGSGIRCVALHIPHSSRHVPAEERRAVQLMMRRSTASATRDGCPHGRLPHRS